MSVDEWLRYGPKEPLIPKVVELHAEPAPGQTITSAPLIPPTAVVTAEPAPGQTVSDAPLIPPVATVAPPRGADP